MRMEEDRSHMTEGILKFTLEIIYLLTGERFPLVKSGDHMTITVPPCDSLKPERHNMEKILEVTKKMMELLTGESGNLGDDNTVKEEFTERDEEYGVMKDLSEGHKEVTMEPPERCPRLLYAENSTQEGHNYAKSDQIQSGNLRHYNIDVKEEYTEEDERCRMIKEFSESPQDHPIPHHHQMLSSVILLVSDEGIINLNVGSELEEMYLRGDQQYTEEAGMTRTFIEEDTPTEISTGHAMEKPSKDRLTLSPGCRMEDEDITGDCGGEKTMISTMDGGLHSVDRPRNPSDSDQPRTVGDGAGIRGEGKFSCAEPEESFSSELSPHRNHGGEKLYSCPECRKCFQRKSESIIHQRSHPGERPYSCSECGQCYPCKPALVRHLKTHTGEKLYPCSECGKSFAEKSRLDDHLRTHLEGILYSCSECGKCYSQKEKLVKHQKSHTEERPYSCSECGKCYIWKAGLVKHPKSHTGERPYSCHECGQCFPVKSTLIRHLKTHTGEKPYSCSECGKCFAEKSRLNNHLKTHVGDTRWSCPECGKYCRWKSELLIHQRFHTGEKPYSCPECGKCFPKKSALNRHQRVHTSKKT
ncbi:uncharacterized protein LOC143955703 [Lithobates pipiens]